MDHKSKKCLRFRCVRGLFVRGREPADIAVRAEGTFPKRNRNTDIITELKVDIVDLRKALDDERRSHATEIVKFHDETHQLRIKLENVNKSKANEIEILATALSEAK